jgi:hypothetical protein
MMNGRECLDKTKILPSKLRAGDEIVPWLGMTSGIVQKVTTYQRAGKTTLGVEITLASGKINTSDDYPIEIRHE